MYFSTQKNQYNNQYDLKENKNVKFILLGSL